MDHEQEEKLHLTKALVDTGKMWINPTAWKEVESQRKAREEAESRGEPGSEQGFLNFERENAEFDEQIARSDVSRGIFVTDETTQSVLATQGSISRAEWNASRGLSPDEPVSSFSAPTESEIELAKKAEAFLLRHGDSSSSPKVLSELLKRAVNGNGT